MTKPNAIILSVAFLVVFAFLAVNVQTVKAAPVCSPDGVRTTPTPGTIVLTQDSDITVTFNCSTSAWNDAFGLSSPNNVRFGYGHSTAAGTTFNAGHFNAGTELVFFLTNPRGNTWLNGPAYRNSDGAVHADVRAFSANTWQVGFEDESAGSSDFDYNDVLFTVTVTPTTPVCTPAWQTGAWSTCSSSGIQTRTVTDSNNCGVTTGQPASTQSCTPTQVCTDSDWTYVLSPSTCPSTEIQTKTWTKIGNCVGGVNHPAYETVSCNYQAPTCTSWTYTNWSTCSTSGTQTRSVINSYPTGCVGGNPTTSQSCTPPTNTLSVSCYASPNPVNANQSVSFICNVSGGTGNYTYSWTGACSSNSAVCTTSFANAGTQTATVAVTSGTQTNYGSATVTINGNNNNCTQNSYQRCSGSYLYWYDSCGNQQGNGLYCSNGCYNNSCTNNNNCTYHSYQQCIGNNLYWYDSCGAQQGVSQYCTNGCYGNSCSNNPYNPYGNCTYHAYKLCVGNSIYWYDSCGNQQDIFQTCVGTNMVCKYGQCTYQQPYVPPYNPYVVHYKIACYSNNLYWYDSLGRTSGLYTSCVDTNSCTLDSCAGSRCSNTIKCDGSTCATESADYKNYCASQNPVITPTQNNLAISFFAKQDQTSLQWQKTIQLNPNGQVYFMMSIANNSGAQVDNVSVLANIPTEISSLGNLQVNGVPVSGDIVSGINIGSLAPASAKSITFEGKAQSFSTQGTKQAVATSNVSGATQSDSLTVNLNPSQVAGASVSSATATSGWASFWSFLKRWYLWILVGLVLIFLFIIVFRRLSNNA